MIASMMRKGMLGDGSTLTLDFTTGVLDSRLTFTRASTVATYINSSGLIATASTNVARFDYDPTTLSPRGLLIEGTATNIATNSNLQAAWTGGTGTTVTANTNEVTSPDGTNNAAKIALTNTGYCSRFESVTGLANATTYTFSYWIRGTAGNQQRVYSATQGADLVTQSTLTYTSTGWTRVQITFTSGAVNNNVYIYVASRPTGTVNDVLYVYGCQLEAGSGASSYIPTGASTANRAQDQMQMTNLASLGFNTNAGTMTINGTYNKDANAFPRSIRFMGSSVQSMAMITAGKTLYGNTPNTSGGSYFETSRTLASAGAFKFGWTLTTAVNPALASATVSLNGSSTSINPIGQGAIVNPVTLDFLYGAGAPTDYPSMNVASMKYWPYAMTSTKLNAMTT